MHDTQLSRDANIKDILNNSDILSDSGRFLCVNAYFEASIHIIFFVSNHGKQNRKKNVESSVLRHFLYAQLKIVGLK